MQPLCIELQVAYSVYAHVAHMRLGVCGKTFIDKRTPASAHKFDVAFAYGVSDTPTHAVAAARDRHANTATVRPRERDKMLFS